ncbi:transporter substrate-binding domain-containing protein [Bacillus aquiflavi]|uniref:Transporter substrate-binding domain-containing protein n=1 Tax=Bacillus aquiflavi TaxID=2672567 RepID=A0A6B3VW97_9BACI|nr:transporter substrate-binding domain-containing protein [Bacillus aquiflavi]MBA4537261.1 transporter substrate-binding domain-containing protein [Bacillus aquiflavi]NEY81518.1 transporter substrate-binding domain-containing protein [Bacillus aquiflavi]UAC49477.1 transporter substrate-binding domain-containing protein [Bacillus aquiflavi]
MKKFWLLLGLLFMITGCAQSTEKAVTEDGKNIVKVALSDEVNPPFLYADEKNNPIGYDIDYLKEVEKRLQDYKFEYIWGEEEANLVGVDSGKYDFVINWFFKNPEREEKFHYPEHEYGYSLTSLVTKKDRTDIKTLNDMVGKKLTPMSPSGGLRSILNAYNEQHSDNPLQIESIESPSNAENLKLVDKGKRDAMFINVTTFNEIQKELNLNLKIAGIISKEPIWTVYHKENKELAQKIDQITIELIEDGTLSKLAEKWFDVDFFKDIDYINEEGFKYN